MEKYTLIKEDNFESARKKIRQSKLPIIFSSGDDELNRKILEKEKIDILLIKLAEKKDRPKQRESGLDQVMAKIAKKNNITIGINFDEIIGSEKNKKAQILARIKQNIKLCNKNKIHMIFISPSGKNQRNFHDLRALGASLGMPTTMIKK